MNVVEWYGGRRHRQIRKNPGRDASIPTDRARIWDRVQKSPQNRDFWTLLYFSGTCDVQEKGKSIPLALSNAAASSTFGDSSDDEQAILIVKGSNLRRCMLDRGEPSGQSIANWTGRNFRRGQLRLVYCCE